MHAATGISQAVKTEFNFRIHVAATILAIGLGVVLQISRLEWLFVIGCCMFVLSMELLNTAVEIVCDLITESYHPVIKIIKDTAAGAVLISSVGSLITGAIIFLPHLFQFINFSK